MNNFELNVLLKKENLKIVPGCIVNNEIDNIFIDKRIGSDSVDGEAYNGCYLKSCKFKLAIKKIPITTSELKLISQSEEPEVLNKYQVYTELLFMKLTNFLVNKGITINLPIIYNKYLCEGKCDFQNKSIPSSIKNCIVMVSELADGDLSKLLKDTKMTIDETKLVYFQIYAALYCFHKYLGAVHNDLHWGNVLFHKIPAGGYFEYIIEGKNIIVPNIGYVMVLWDFGRSFIPGKLTFNDRNKKDATIDEDYRRITDMLYDNKTPGTTSINTDNNKLAKALHLLMDRSSSHSQFVLNYSKYVSVPKTKDTQIIATFNMDKKVTTKDPMISRYLKNKTKPKTNPKTNTIKTIKTTKELMTPKTTTSPKTTKKN